MSKSGPTTDSTFAWRFEDGRVEFSAHPIGLLTISVIEGDGREEVTVWDADNIHAPHVEALRDWLEAVIPILQGRREYRP